MANSTAEIERIVREVLIDLGWTAQPEDVPVATGDAPKSEAEAKTAKPAAEPAVPARPAGDVVVAQRVVTLVDLGERIHAAQRLVVPPGAVVTPSVRDELRRRNVSLVFENAVSPTTSGLAPVAMTVLGSKIDPKPLVDELERAGHAVDLQRTDCLVRATDDMADQLKQGNTAGVLLTNYGAIAMCLANRHRGVRAVLASDESRAAADAVSVGANLLVVEPRRTAPETVRRIVTAFCRQGPGQCPEDLRDRLG